MLGREGKYLMFNKKGRCSIIFPGVSQGKQLVVFGIVLWQLPFVFFRVKRLKFIYVATFVFKIFGVFLVKKILILFFSKVYFF